MGRIRKPALVISFLAFSPLGFASSQATYLVHLKGRLDTKQHSKIIDVEKRQAAVVADLIAINQREIDSLLIGIQRKGMNVSGVTPLWISNSVRVVASEEAAKQLAAAPNVESVEIETLKLSELEPYEAEKERALSNETIAWGVENIKAPEVWAKGYEGQNVLVGVIDTGTNLKHPDLDASRWKNPGESGVDADGKDKEKNEMDDDGNGFVDDVYGWNFDNGNNNVNDNYGHGAQVAGIVAGTGVGGTKTGVAPKATVLTIKTANSLSTFESKTWEALQYALTMKVRVINMSMRIYHSYKPKYEKWRQIGENLLAAEVIHVNAAGNEGSGSEPFNIAAPPSNPPAWFHPKLPLTGGRSSMIAVGATDDENILQDFSSLGPVQWKDIGSYNDYHYEKDSKPGLMKPEICGPSEVPAPSHNGTGYYQGFSGTSSASPHVAGVVALLLSAKPKLTVAQVTETLQNTAVSYEDSFNNKCGPGRVDAKAAIEYALQRF